MTDRPFGSTGSRSASTASRGFILFNRSLPLNSTCDIVPVTPPGVGVDRRAFRPGVAAAVPVLAALRSSLWSQALGYEIIDDAPAPTRDEDSETSKTARTSRGCATAAIAATTFARRRRRIGAASSQIGGLPVTAQGSTRGRVQNARFRRRPHLGGRCRSLSGPRRPRAGVRQFIPEARVACRSHRVTSSCTAVGRRALKTTAARSSGGMPTLSGLGGERSALRFHGAKRREDPGRGTMRSGRAAS
jgi:hypothetical protein